MADKKSKQSAKDTKEKSKAIEKADNISVLEEDDEFEEFPAEDWEAKDEDETEANVWEDNWDDDTIEDDFSKQLRAELQKRGVAGDAHSLKEDRDIMLARHKKEAQELHNKIQAMKSAAKNNKKRKKEIALEIALMEADMSTKHAAELAVVEGCDLRQSAAGIEKLDLNGIGNVPLNSQTRVSKAQKRRDRKQAKEQERQQFIDEQEKQNLLGVRHVEAQNLKVKLEARQLAVFEIPSDGDCLYNAVIHQVRQHGLDYSVAALRRQTAEHIRAHKEDFIPYLVKPESGEMLNDAEFEHYCTLLESTAAWGGQVEITALAQLLHRTIEVLQADGAPVIAGEEFTDQNSSLILTYHRHTYGLGEHYNSVKSMACDADEFYNGVVQPDNHGEPA